MKNVSYTFGCIRIIITLLLIIPVYNSSAQHIQYRHKLKSSVQSVPENIIIPVPDTTIKTIAVVITKDTPETFIKSRAAITKNPRHKKPYDEPQNMCNLLSRPELAPKLPLVVNQVSPEMVKLLRERYEGRLYSITGLNMMDERLKYKLKICDKDNGKFRSEYLDKDGKVVSDPDFDYN